MEVNNSRKKRALSREDARLVRQRGYDDALEFANAIGLDKDYKNDRLAKKDVIDPSGDAHSVKGGVKKWQVFLYSLTRFTEDDSWVVMNGIGELLANCIKCFPPNIEDYKRDKLSAKNKLRIHMVAIAEKLKSKHRLRAFFNKSLFNGGEVDYLTVKHEGKFHVFLNKDVIDVMADNLEVCNSLARKKGDIPEQKVLFRYNSKNLGELEMRNEGYPHYREIRFNMIKPVVINLLFTKMTKFTFYNDKVLVYENANKKFGRW